jgi:hypothetical protein
MKTIRGVILAALVVAALTAFPALASASAGISADQYTATLHGETPGETLYLGIGSAEMRCPGLDFEASLSGPALSVTTSSVKDQYCGASGNLGMNGCQLELKPAGSGSIVVGPSKCGPVNFAIGACTGLSIPSGTRIDANYANTGSGSGARILITVNDYIEYVSNYGSCGGKGTHKDLHMIAEWEVTATNASKNPIGTKAVTGGALFVGGGEAGSLQAVEYPATVTGERLNLAPYEGKVNLLEFPQGKTTGKISCSGVSLSGSEKLIAPASSFGLNATYSGCKFSSVEWAVSMSSCYYAYSALKSVGSGEYTSVAKISCNAGDVIKISASGCTLAIPAQTLSGGAAFTNTEIESKAYLVGIMTGTGVKYTSTGASCALIGLKNGGSYENGSTESDMLLVGELPS